MYCERCGAYAWKRTAQLHRDCTPGRSKGLDAQLSRIRRGMHPAMSERGGIERQAVLAPPLAALQVEKLAVRAAEFDAKLEPRAKLRRMMDGTSDQEIAGAFEMRGVLLSRYGIRLEEVAAICADTRAAAAANRPKKRRLTTKTRVPVQCGESGVEEGRAFQQARVFKAREGRSRYTADGMEGASASADA